MKSSHLRIGITSAALLAILGTCIAQHQPDSTQAVKHASAQVKDTNQPPAAVPQQLQSVKAAGSNGSVLVPKGIGIVLHGVWAIQAGQQVILVVPERYLFDLTNLYRAQYISKINLEEP
jgi:hypothetical protein